MLLLLAMLYFNSIKVQLRRKQIFTYSRVGTLFQFHKGTIKTIGKGDRKIFGARFQFHKGTIKTVVCLHGGKVVWDFNSIKVQLRLERMERRKDRRTIFQFHKGTIKTAVMTNRTFVLRYFNSIKVQLGQLYPNQLTIYHTNFNSIKVQLRPYTPPSSDSNSKFQFHKGTIKTAVALFNFFFAAISIP